MNNFDYEPIPHQDEFGSSAFLFDLRNSTAITRRISWDKRLPIHINFMMELNKKVYETIYNNCNPEEFAMNDTGDGYLCVFWDKLHALTCLDTAIRIQEFLELELPKHNAALKAVKPEDDIPKFDYGFAIHSGASTINRTTYTKNGKPVYKDFIFGIVANTVARLEAFTKNYIEFKFLVTENYKDNYLKQVKQVTNKDNLSNLFEDKNRYVHESLGRVNIKDGKENSKIGNKGHIVYALSADFLTKFKEYYAL